MRRLTERDFLNDLEKTALRLRRWRFIPGTKLKVRWLEDRIHAGDDLMATLADFGVVPVYDFRLRQLLAIEESCKAIEEASSP